MRRTVLILFLLHAGIASGIVAQTSDGPFEVRRLAADHWRITVRNPEPRVLRMPGDPPYSRVDIPGYEQQLRPGQPELPLKHFSFYIANKDF